MTSPAIDPKDLKTFCSLSAGSTVIMPDGKVLRFGGKPGGHGTYQTASREEQRWLSDMSKLPSPQVWEESKEEVDEMPTAVKTGVVSDIVKTVTEVMDRADVAVKAEVTNAVNNAPAVTATASAAK